MKLSALQVYTQLERHGLKSGYYLEVLHPIDRDAFYPAEVVSVLNNYYFVVQLFTDTVHDNQPSNTQRFKLHKQSTGFAPMGWCAKNHIRLGKEGKFNWALFERKRHVKNYRSNFFDNTVESRPWRAGHYVEVAVGTGPVDEFALGIVIRVSSPFVWVQSDYFGPQRYRIFDISDCTDLYPCGWSSAIDAPLNVYQKIPSPLEPLDCSDITVYVNIGCSLGPHLCRTVLQKYPSVLGPGPVAKVLGYLFKIILASVHRPAPLCRAFYASFSQFCPSNKVLPVKANYANGQRLVELVVCDDARHVPNFLYHISVLLGACCSSFSVKKLGSAGCPFKCTYKSGLRHSCPSCSTETRRALPVVKRQPKNKRRILFSKQGEPSPKRDKPTLDVVAMTVEEVQREVVAAAQSRAAGLEGKVLARRNPSIYEAELSKMRAPARQTQPVAPVVIATAVPVVPTVEKTDVDELAASLPLGDALKASEIARFLRDTSERVFQQSSPPTKRWQNCCWP
ncbi:mbt repeat protein [Trichuris suis]|nr:mbt repeat protein [Trichuris suis]